MYMQHAGGMLLPPVQTLVATAIFAEGKNATKSGRYLRFCSNQIWPVPPKLSMDLSCLAVSFVLPYIQK
jgi:hypothetical protein